MLSTQNLVHSRAVTELLVRCVLVLSAEAGVARDSLMFIDVWA